MWPLVELEQTFSQTSHKGAHLSNGTFSRGLKFRQFWFVAVFCSLLLEALQRQKRWPISRQPFLSGRKNIEKVRIRWVKYKKINYLFLLLTLLKIRDSKVLSNETSEVHLAECLYFQRQDLKPSVKEHLKISSQVFPGGGTGFTKVQVVSRR